MPETLATIDFSPLACTIGTALLGSDGSQCQYDCTQGKLTAFCYRFGWYLVLDLG